MHQEETVIVVDDDGSVREGLDSLFRSAGLMVRLFDSAEAFLAAPPADRPSCLVLDVRMPGMTGMELQQQLLASSENLPVVFLTGHGDVPMSVQALKSGAADFLLKPFREADLLHSVRAGIERHRQHLAAKRQEKELSQSAARLTRRERQVLVLVSHGLLNKQIAQRLGISEVMTKVHRANMMRKLGAGNIVDLVRIADKLAIQAGAEPTEPGSNPRGNQRDFRG